MGYNPTPHQSIFPISTVGLLKLVKRYSVAISTQTNQGFGSYSMYILWHVVYTYYRSLIVCSVRGVLSNSWCEYNSYVKVFGYIVLRLKMTGTSATTYSNIADDRNTDTPFT